MRAPTCIGMAWLGLGLIVVAACGDGATDAKEGSGGNGSSGGSSQSGSGDPSGSSGSSGAPPKPSDIPPAPPLAGNPDGKCAVPPEAGPEDTSSPKTVVGTGTPESCTSEKFVAAVAAGGVITFNCGANPTTITVTETAKVWNDKGPKVVIDGGGKITLSGGGTKRILYQNSCSSELNGGSGCNDKNEPLLVVQNITFADASSKGIADTDNAAGGGAIWVRGGRFKAYNARFFGNTCDELGSDLAGAAIRILDFPSSEDSINRPMYMVHSTFGGQNLGNKCANGGAVGSISASMTIINSLFTNNEATGMGASSGQGGNGGAIYNDGRRFRLTLCGTKIENNHGNAGGSAVFYVSNTKNGELVIKDSVIQNNPLGDFETQNFPGFFILGATPQVTNSTIKR